MLTQAMDRNRVKGFLHTEGCRVLNGEGEEVILNGWGFGNWLLCEGYMWMCGEGNRFERPRRIEEVVRELTGSDFAERFWKEFRENYITREDVRHLAELGYNSVRIPFTSRVLLEEEPGLLWREEGFQLLDRCIDWCEEFGIYVFLDMHGAPGGQTGANIDDSIDDVPRLFLDADSWNKALEIWGKLADRYADRWIVGGYDLLNEPIRPASGNMVNYDGLVPRLIQFYEEAIDRIRRHDKRHMLSIEGHHWSTDPAVFCKKFDDNMVIHFHRYGCLPDLSCYRVFLETSQRLDQPLWLGETGENCMEWFTAMYPLAASLGFGYNLWTWKRMESDCSPLSVKRPEGWEEIIGYTAGGPRPSYQRAQQIFTEYLQNIRFEDCRKNRYITDAVCRRPGFAILGVDFDQFPGKGISFSGLRQEDNWMQYRMGTGMGILRGREKGKKRGFDSGWDSNTLELRTGEFAVYTAAELQTGDQVSLELVCREEAELSLTQDGSPLGTLSVQPGETLQKTAPLFLNEAEKGAVKVLVQKGRVELDRLTFLREMC